MNQISSAFTIRAHTALGAAEFPCSSRIVMRIVS